MLSLTSDRECLLPQGEPAVICCNRSGGAPGTGDAHSPAPQQLLLTQLLEAIPHPAALLDASSAVRAENRSSRLLREAQPGGRSEKTCYMAFGDRRAARQLRVRTAEACKAGETITIVARDEHGACRAILSVYPVSLGSLSGVCPAHDLALVVVREVAARRLPSSALLREAFGLTRAEARLAGRIALGCSVEEAAAALGVTKDTARSHLKSIFLKTNAHRQSELVASLISLGA